MDVERDQITIEYPPDVDLLMDVQNETVLIATADTDKYLSLDALVQMNLLIKRELKFNYEGKMYQFELSPDGRKLLLPLNEKKELLYV